jgi:hypothetical protein
VDVAAGELDGHVGRRDVDLTCLEDGAAPQHDHGELRGAAQHLREVTGVCRREVLDDDVRRLVAGVEGHEHLPRGLDAARGRSDPHDSIHA